MKKHFFCIGILIMSFLFFTACRNKMTTYTYENEAILDIKIEKAEAYIDKLVVTFAEGSLSGVKKAECYGSDFAVIEEEPEFTFKNDVLTIETDNADMISGMKVWDSDRDLYFYVRYMDSDSYAMLVYSWADDVGYMVNGDEDAYYTQEEKDEQKELAEIQAEAEAYAYSKLRGEWINESEDTRIIFDSNSDYGRNFSVCKLENGEWIEHDSMSIGEISPHGNDTMALFDNPSFGRQVIVEIEDDNTMKFDYSEELYYRKSDVN